MLSAKTCTMCSTEKPIAEFAKRVLKSGTVSAFPWCRPCVKIRYQLKKNSVHANYWANRDARKHQRIQRKYGLTALEFQHMKALQAHCCKICGLPENKKDHRTGKTRELAIDHCHVTGRVRGLLCTACNQGLGMFTDNPIKLEKAARYLRGRG